ncbi:transmembrane protein 74B-like [Acipenser oxyrinchus oxyrinchus]|uniref:Transmembrane protein 74B-like n=1 Tax=Acipenser oxyrinchus oxyrinchus TaxID=40147 RepID=A0AAD8CVQ5_ACIOX|nr:transmembrane protein 74B-like [Acipenser oxyrinchus oxyrinchus]
MTSLNSLELEHVGDCNRINRPQLNPGNASASGPRTAPCAGIDNASFQDEEQQETSFTNRANADQGKHNRTSPTGTHGGPNSEAFEEHEAEIGAPSVDYGFIFSLVFLLSGIVLVVIAYTIPREAKVNPDFVTAREMEKLERYYARLGSHLDRCIIAGLGLLTLGGMLLSMLLMVSICKGDLYRRRTFSISRRSKKTYGSINLRMKRMEGDGRQSLVDCEPAPVTCAVHSQRSS